MRPLDSTGLNYDKHTKMTNNAFVQGDLVEEVTKRKGLRSLAKTKIEGYRTGYDIIYEVLIVLTKSRVPLTASRMSAYAGLSYAQIKEFLIGLMMPAELVEFQEDSYLRVLPAGYEYMRLFKELREVLRLADTLGEAKKKKPIG